MLRRDTQTSLLGTVFLLAASQLTLSIILLYQTFNFDMKPVSSPIVIARFICGLVFHIYLQAEFAQGYSNMKCALNHPWKFEAPILAFYVGFVQTFVVFVIELINYILLVGNNTYKDIVLSVLSLFFIVNFSHFFYNQPYTGIEFKKIISGKDDRYQSFLRKQLKSSPRFTIFRTRK